MASMERGSSDKGAAPDEEDADQTGSFTTSGSERSEDEVTTSQDGVAETSVDSLAERLRRGPADLEQETQPPCHFPSEGQAEVVDGEKEEISASPSLSPPISLMDTFGPSILSLASSISSHRHHTDFSSSSSSSSVLSLTPPLPPAVELSAVLTDTRLTLDLYNGGTAALTLLWKFVPERLCSLKYLRLGSEDRQGLDAALDVIPHLTKLQSLSIRGHCFYDSHGDPLPGLLTTLPTTFSSLSHLDHLDLSFNQLSCLPDALLRIPTLTTLLLSHNRISALPPHISLLFSLSYLSLLGNELVSLPASLGQLKALRTLDVSYNCLERLPDEIGSLERLVKLEVSHNKLKQLPETMGSLLSLRELNVCSNELRLMPDSLGKLPLLRMDLRDNLIGRPPTPPPLPPVADKLPKSVPELHLSYDQHSFCVSPAGCHVFLPGGGELFFPPGSVEAKTRLEWTVKMPERKWVWLEEYDILLSPPLELRPHGVTFLQPVSVCVPYQRTKRKTVVLRKFDGKSWSTLPTLLRRGSESHSCHPGGRPARLACCSVSEFSWFMAVSCPVKDLCAVAPSGAMLVSSSDPGVKLNFPPHCTVETRTITLQVLEVFVTEVQTLCGDPQAKVSPLVCLSQTPNMQFLQPIKVQIPLPPGVTGHTVDMSRLHLLHGDPTAHTWTDITSQVSLQTTHLYAIFYIQQFSWYWLWYTTQQYVSGAARKVYQRLKQFKVQFLVLQRKVDPSQVLLQCLPANKVESRVESLSEQYDGPQPSDLCDLLEGEQFFAGFERGLDISADRPDCVGGRLCFVFYSSLKNLKEVYICPAEGQKGPVRGQVSFYRGEIPRHLPEDVVRKRKGHDSQWLTTLPLRLPALNSDNKYITEEPQYPPLNLGDPESGYLTEANLLSISLQIGKDWRDIAINLGLSYQELDRIQYKHRDNLGAAVLDMLFHWARRQSKAGPGAVSKLVTAMTESGRRDIADEIEDIVSIGKRKYSESLQRLGLETESPSVDDG